MRDPDTIIGNDAAIVRGAQLLADILQDAAQSIATNPHIDRPAPLTAAELAAVPADAACEQNAAVNQFLLDLADQLLTDDPAVPATPPVFAPVVANNDG